MIFKIRPIIQMLRPVKHRLATVPILVLLPTSQCNCRCIMCDYWKNKPEEKEMTLDDLIGQEESIKRLKVQWVVLSGGEPLLHPEWPAICDLLKSWKIRVSLLTNGLLLKARAEAVRNACDEVIVSLDGPKEIHDKIRGVDGAFDKLREGVKALKGLDPLYPVTGRCVLQKENLGVFADIIDAAKEINLDRISFLPADLSAHAFNRNRPPGQSEEGSVLPDSREIKRLEQTLDHAFQKQEKAFQSGFVAESPKRLRSMVRYFEALNGNADFKAPLCNAPWVSAVIEADGTVRPCFFQRPYGNIHADNLDRIVNSGQAVAFRKSLKIKNDPICQRCVCPLYRP